MEHQKKACRLKRHTIVVFTKHLPRNYKHKGAFFVIIPVGGINLVHT